MMKKNKVLYPEEILNKGLIGLFVHVKIIQDDGSLNDWSWYQGRILAIVNNYALIETYSWFDGRKYVIVSYPLDVLLAPDNALFYRTDEDMNDFYDRKLHYRIEAAEKERDKGIMGCKK